ncbi:MAG: alpha-glucuronidase family glycosyl hydrolase [Planctomycetota bacterium]|jgi:alpha-glucuronidase
MNKRRLTVFLTACMLVAGPFANLSFGNDKGYKAWLMYQTIEDKSLLNEYSQYCREISVAGDNTLLESAVEELKTGIKGMLGERVKVTNSFSKGIVLGTASELSKKNMKLNQESYGELSDEGFSIRSDQPRLIITAKTEQGVLYGVFHLLRLMQTHQRISALNISQSPAIKLRLLNHWDNPGKVPRGRSSVERGYAGDSIFKWDKLAEHEQRYVDYARMLASTGINGSVLNNVNTAKNGLQGWKLLTPEYLPKLTYLADLFRRYGIRLYISVNFFSPKIVGGMEDADPSKPDVQKWWNDKAAEIYKAIPDFGGYLVKADSEGEPGPMKYGLNHADGANMLARSLKPHGGIVMWRAFVYGHKKSNPDRAAQAYEIFKPLDGQFDDNALVQIKNGPHDFQVREPVSPLFSAMPQTNQMLELQITQEYTGHSRHVCFLVPQWKTVLDFDTHAKGKGTEVKKVLSGEAFKYTNSGIAGVSNIGDDQNWTGHLLAQANLYGFGRLAWNPDLSTTQIADEWIHQTFGDNEKVIKVIGGILNSSWRTYEDYTMPLGIGFMSNGGRDNDESHFRPAPAKRKKYHRADQKGVGYDRTQATGSRFAGQYHPPVCDRYENIETCPEELLLFFHHVPYTYRLKSGKTVIQHIYDSHNDGVLQVEKYLNDWKTLKGLIDNERFEHVSDKLREQIKYAKEWRDSINAYFFKESGIKDNRNN